MDNPRDQEEQELQTQRDLLLAVTSSLIPLSLAAARTATSFAEYVPSMQEKFQRIEQVSREPGVGLAYLLAAGLVYVSGIATMIVEHYQQKIDTLRYKKD